MKKYIREGNGLSVCLIKASAPSSFKEYKKSMLGLPQNIFSVAACTPEGVGIQMIDETVGIKVDYNTKADLILIMFSTPDALQGYAIADKFRAKGKTVVLGGLHVSFMKEEALEHADALLVGEAEGIWEELLDDFQNGNLSEIYENPYPVDLANLNPYPTDIIPAEVYDHSWTVMVSRGCINKCAYCTVHKFFPKYRKRPIEDVIDEIRNAPTDFLELKADNFMVDREYALELFRQMEDLDVVWFTALEPSFADDEELVIAAHRSGLRSILLGIETPAKNVLADNRKAHLDLERLKKQISFLHEHDIEIDSAMLFGFDGHDKDIFKETLDFALDIDIDVSHGVIPIPFPGTELYRKLEFEGRIVTKDWSKYDGAHMVYTHPTLTAKEVENGAYWFDVNFAKKHKNRSFEWHKRWGGGFSNKSKSSLATWFGF